jgi:transposase InsO family protein
LRFGVQLEKTPYYCLRGLLSGMVFRNRYSLTKGPSLSLIAAESEFARHYKDLGIKHITASVRQTDNYWQNRGAPPHAYEVESHLFKEHWSFIRYYNYTRPHESLNYLTPSEICLKDRV